MKTKNLTRMKKTVLLAFSLIATLAVAQPTNGVDANNTTETNTLQSLAGNVNQGSAITGAATFYNPKFDKEGSVYLFDDWDNDAMVFAKNNAGAFRAYNINFNVQRSMFETKKNDSIKSYNFANIEKITLKGREFKSYYFEPLERQKVFEVIYEGDDFSILKGYKTDILQGNPNPMLGRMRDKIIQREKYYIDTEESLKEFKFKKSNILKALGTEKAELAREYAKKYKMSFRNEKDLKKILNYVKRQ